MERDGCARVVLVGLSVDRAGSPSSSRVPELDCPWHRLRQMGGGFDGGGRTMGESDTMARQSR